MRVLDNLFPVWKYIFIADPPLRGLMRRLTSSGFDFARFRSSIGYRPRKWRLFLEALLHRSYLQFVEAGWSSNERLEFLGDSVLNAVVAEHLFSAYPSLEEGDLTKLRSRLVNRKVLAQLAKEMRLTDFLLLSASASQSIDTGSDSILADAFEAVIGAIYLDGGTDSAKAFVLRTILANEGVYRNALTDDNYKSALLEYSQGRGLGIPRYAVVKEEGPEHDRRFTIEVLLGTSAYGEGSGRSKKEAEQAAAAQALERIQSRNDNPSHPRPQRNEGI